MSASAGDSARLEADALGVEAPTIEARGLGRSYGGVRVLRDVDLALPAGSKTALLGSNGAGKTTLINLLSTLVSPTSGTFRIAGMDAKAPRVRHALGVLGHRPMLYEDFSPLENLQFFAQVYGVEDAPARIEELLRAGGLWMRRHEQTAILSRGYHQRLALARALLHRPAVLIADEPETGLDPDGVALLDELALCAPRLTVLAATHRIDHIDAWATGVVRLERGRVVEDTASIVEARL
ncbi:MAG: ABC transporter ATP-binding protein [Chloroflexi bacterium]|nr:ABC transporter ATP-binding protein [Chloroflexota bacterium]